MIGNNGIKDNRAEVIEGHCSKLWYWYNDGCFKAGRDNGLGQGEVKYVGEDLRQLFGTGYRCHQGQQLFLHLSTQSEAHTTGEKCEWFECISSFAVSELRFILLGKSVSDTSSVGNLLLGRSVLETKDPLHSVLQCERVRGHVKGRYITIINAPHLFDQTFSHHQLTLCIKECVSLSAPGPHVIMLIVEPENFSETDKRRADHILLSLSEEAHKYTMVITTKNIEIGSSVDPVEENVIQKIIVERNYRHLNFSGCTQADLVEKMEEMVKENKGSLFCDIYEDAETAIGQHESEQIIEQPEHEVTETLEEHIQTNRNVCSNTQKNPHLKNLKLVKKQHSGKY
ncbi:GTPase IMAP family member 9-like [Tachysurus vachellii]|uniref:GTPase IMAP family member 9-like n=1 Tax=Tachysurus vachellii TaxID=175792 RepID=UPI00296B14D0|nr:GTPase IMAP family member 9-like [Tachysurus vachellii]